MSTLSFLTSEAATNSFTAEQKEQLTALYEDVVQRLEVKPHRLEHVLRVADTAFELASIYDVDCFQATAAALLHDWYKDGTDAELVPLAAELGIDLGVELELVAPLLHGLIAAKTLPAHYPELPREIFRAIEVHTQGAADMSPLDMVLFVADGIEPGRSAAPAIEQVRKLVREAPLFDLYWESFSSGIVYVIETGRYLYPGTIDVYNQLVAQRAEKEHA